MSLINDSPPFVTIVSVYHLANLTAGDRTWPIIWEQPFLQPASFWNITKSLDGNSLYQIQDNEYKRYLVPGTDGESTTLSNQTFSWKIEPAGGDKVNLYTITHPSSGKVLTPGILFADPAGSYGVNLYTKDADQPSKYLWIIEMARI